MARAGVEPAHIYHAMDFTLAAIVAVAVLVAFGVSQGRTNDLMAKRLDVLSQARREFFDNSLKSHLSKALQASSRPGIIADVRSTGIEAGALRQAALERLNASAKAFLGYGLTGFAYQGPAGKTSTANECIFKPFKQLRSMKC